MAWKANEQVRAHLPGDLYESVLAPERVPDVLRALNAHLDCDSVHLVGWQEDSGAAIVSLVTSPHIAVAEKAYLDHYAVIDPRTDMGTRRPLGVGGACHDFFDDAFVTQDEFYSDFLISLKEGTLRTHARALLEKRTQPASNVCFQRWCGDGRPVRFTIPCMNLPQGALCLSGHRSFYSMPNGRVMSYTC